MLRALVTFIVVTVVLCVAIGTFGWIGPFELLLILLVALAAATVVHRAKLFSS